MVKKHIITLAGYPGSGKSTTARSVAAELGYEHFSSGDLFRRLAKEHGINVLQANLLSERDPGLNLDSLVDGRLQEIGQTQDELVVDSRTAWHWMPSSFKVFLDLDLQVGAARILRDMDKERRASEHVPDDPAEYAAQMKDRLDSESRRYRTLYGIDPYDMENYDLVVDTAAHGPNEVVKLVLNGFERWLAASHMDL